MQTDYYVLRNSNKIVKRLSIYNNMRSKRAKEIIPVMYTYFLTYACFIMFGKFNMPKHKDDLKSMLNFTDNLMITFATECSTIDEKTMKHFYPTLDKLGCIDSNAFKCIGN